MVASLTDLLLNYNIVNAAHFQHSHVALFLAARPGCIRWYQAALHVLQASVQTQTKATPTSKHTLYSDVFKLQA